MSDRVSSHGTVLTTAASGDKITAFSLDDAKVFTKSANESYWGLLSKITAGTEYTSAALSAAKDVRIEAGGSEVLYSIGTDPIIIERRGQRGQGAPGVLNATGALTAAMIGPGIVTSAAATVAGTLPTGAVMDAAFDMEIGDSFDWSVIKVGANAFTVTAAATGHTIVGLAVVATATAGMFRTRKTAAATYITYRIG